MLFEIVKLLFQKDTRDTFKELFALIKRNPEWKRDLVNLDERFQGSETDRIQVLIKFIRESLVEKGWPENRAGVVEFAIQEVADNACTHGRNDDGSQGIVRIRAVLSGDWVNCEVTDSGSGFVLSHALSKQMTGEPHGLTRIKAVASVLNQPKSNTIFLTIVREPGRIEFQSCDGNTSITITGRLDEKALNSNSDFDNIGKRVLEGSRIIIDLTETTYVSSIGLRFLIMLQKNNKLYGRKAVLVGMALTLAR